MREEIKKSFNIIIKNPYIILLFIVYLLATESLMPILYSRQSKLAYILVGILALLLSAAFFAGWLGLIKGVVSYKETGNAEEDFKNQYLAFKNDFFSSVALYILPLICYIFILIGYIYGLFYLTDYFIGKPTGLAEGLNALTGNQMDVMQFINALPVETQTLLLKRTAFIIFGNMLFFFFVMYSIPALYFQKSNNPFTGIINGVISIFKKPFFSAGLFLSFLFLNTFIGLFEIFSMSNQILTFLAIVLRVYFTAFIVVLIFSVYERKFTDNSNNRADSLGENGISD